MVALGAQRIRLNPLVAAAAVVQLWLRLLAVLLLLPARLLPLLARVRAVWAQRVLQLLLWLLVVQLRLRLLAVLLLQLARLLPLLAGVPAVWA